MSEPPLSVTAIDELEIETEPSTVRLPPPSATFTVAVDALNAIFRLSEPSRRNLSQAVPLNPYKYPTVPRFVELVATPSEALDVEPVNPPS